MHFSSVELVSFCLVLFSSACSFQFVNKWIHSFVEQFDQEEAAANINSFTYDRQLTRLVVATLLYFRRDVRTLLGVAIYEVSKPPDFHIKMGMSR